MRSPAKDRPQVHGREHGAGKLEGKFWENWILSLYFFMFSIQSIKKKFRK